jgi:hypothetical protein
LLGCAANRRLLEEEDEGCCRADTQLRCNETLEKRGYYMAAQLTGGFWKKKKGGETGRTRSYAATNPWKIGDITWLRS